MARPKKEDAGKARRRILDAFWEMLAEMPYSEISIRALANRAEVNPNTFYSYFDNIDDLARKAFDDNMIREIPARVLRLLEEDRLDTVFSILVRSENRTRVDRALLFARGDSGYLAKMIQDKMQATWLAHFKIDPDRLDASDQLELTFIFGGFITCIRSVASSGDLNTARQFFQRPLYRTMITALSELGERYRHDDRPSA